MPYTGYIVRCRPEHLPDILVGLKSFPDLAVGEPGDHGLPIAAATATSEQAMALNEELERLPNVLNVTLVYHNFEDLAEPLPNTDSTQ